MDEMSTVAMIFKPFYRQDALKQYHMSYNFQLELL